MNSKDKLPLGKLDMDLLEEIFDAYNSDVMLENLDKSALKNNYLASKQRVKLGFSIGEDAAVIDMGDKYLISKTDPITFATNEIGYYVVNVNANDIASMGAVPKWFQATILLPGEHATKSMVKQICLDIQKCCLEIGVVLTGGHTEVTYGIPRPIVIGSMIGEVEKEKLVTTSGGRPGDAIILTKGIPLEGSSIIAREKEKELQKNGIEQDIIDRSKDFLYVPGISVIKEAILAVNNFDIHSMHDPTEGGLAMGLVELSRASQCGFLINYEQIPFIDEGVQLCRQFNIDPLRLISSGALLITVADDDSKELIDLLEENNITAKKIGYLTDDNNYKVKKNGKIQDLYYSEKDELTKIF